MKVKIEIDCTPQEARRFFGLPDLEPIHEAMADQLKDRMTAAAAAIEPEALMKAWMPGGAGYDQMREMFTSAMTGATGAAGAAKKSEDS